MNNRSINIKSRNLLWLVPLIGSLLQPGMRAQETTECYDDVRQVNAPVQILGINFALLCSAYGGTNCIASEANYCRLVTGFSPSPPAQVGVCYQKSYVTKMRCVRKDITVVRTYFNGEPYCRNASTLGECESGCANWDTVASNDSVTFENWDVEDCP